MESESMDKEQDMRLVIEGNAVYEVDQRCLKCGMNSPETGLYDEQDDSDKKDENKHEKKGNRGFYPFLF